jgi:ketosteroid isomerase-like protein
MSRENVETVVEVYEALNRNDVDAVVARLSDDFEFVPPAVLPDVQVYRGAEEFARFWREWTDTFPDARFEIEETIDGGDAVVVMAALRGAGKDSGAAVSTPSFGQVWTVAAGRPIRMEAVPNRAEALRTAGITTDRPPSER